MTREQYEEQKRRLAEQHRSLVEMVNSAYETQLQALDRVWRMLSGEDSPDPRPAPAPAAPPPPPAPPARRRRKAGELYEAVVEILPQLPETFVFSDVCRLLGETPDRGSLYRVLQELKAEGSVAIESTGSGTQPTEYRNLFVPDPEPGA